MDMIRDLVSMFALTINRYEITKRVIQKNIDNAQNFMPIELLVCDNGSTDRRVVDWVSQHPKLHYHRVNSLNEGVGKSFNQLYLRSRGEFLAFTGSDLELPPGWLKEMIGYAKGVPNSGLVGISWGHGGVPPLVDKGGIVAHWLTPRLNRVFGAFVVRRAVIEHIGLFGEEYDVYGLEDSALNERVTRAGYQSLYVPEVNFKCLHVGVGNEDTGEYRKMKDASLSRNTSIFGKQIAAWDQGASLVEVFPRERDPL